MQKLKIVREETLSGDQYLQYKKIFFIDANGNDRVWSFAERPHSNKAVVIIPVTKNKEEMILIRQFRVPLKGYIFEYPAGLMEPNEEIETCAIRELKEETGYSGKILQISPALATSAGISSEQIYLVLVEVNDSPEKQELEACEDIEVFKIKFKDAKAFLLEKSSQGDLIDSKVWAFLGMNAF